MKKFITWKEVDNLVNLLYKYVYPYKKNYKYIYGVSRGGLIPAVMLSHKLGLPLVKSITKGLSKDRMSQILIVDDIIDKGSVMRLLNTKFKYNFNYATLFVNMTNKFSKEEFKYITTAKNSENKWIVFPWEKKNGKTKKDNTEAI